MSDTIDILGEPIPRTVQGALARLNLSLPLLPDSEDCNDLEFLRNQFNEFKAQRDELAEALRAAENFIVGFEDDEAQEGIPELLAKIRAVISKAKDR